MMKIIFLQIAIMLLCFSVLFLGILLIISGQKALRGQNSIVSKSTWDRIFYDYYIWRWLFGEDKGSAYRQIWLGITSLVCGALLLIFLYLGGILL